MRFSAVNPNVFQLWVQLLWRYSAGREHFDDTASKIILAAVRETQFMHLSVMQQNQYCGYPQIFWTNNSALSSSDCAPQLRLYHSSEIVPTQDICLPLPVPGRKRHSQNHGDGTCLCFLVVFLLILLAIMGVGLAMFQIFHLQKELQKVTSQF